MFHNDCFHFLFENVSRRMNKIFYSAYSRTHYNQNLVLIRKMAFSDPDYISADEENGIFRPRLHW